MFVDDLRVKIKGKGVRIVFTEGPDPRVQEAAVRLHKKRSSIRYFWATLLKLRKTAKKYGFDLEGISVMTPERFPGYGSNGYTHDRTSSW